MTENKNLFKANDLVRITDYRDCYPNYTDWMLEYATKEQCCYWTEGYRPMENGYGKVVAIGKHTEVNEWVYLVQIMQGEGTGHFVIFNEEGLDEIGDKDICISCLLDEINSLRRKIKILES